jgi:hypothetical protein
MKEKRHSCGTMKKEIKLQICPRKEYHSDTAQAQKVAGQTVKPPIMNIKQAAITSDSKGTYTVLLVFRKQRHRLLPMFF